MLETLTKVDRRVHATGVNVGQRPDPEAERITSLRGFPEEPAEIVRVYITTTYSVAITQHCDSRPVPMPESALAPRPTWQNQI